MGGGGGGGGDVGESWESQRMKIQNLFMFFLC